MPSNGCKCILATQSLARTATFISCASNVGVAVSVHGTLQPANQPVARSGCLAHYSGLSHTYMTMFELFHDTNLHLCLRGKLSRSPVHPPASEEPHRPERSSDGLRKWSCCTQCLHC